MPRKLMLQCMDSEELMEYQAWMRLQREAALGTKTESVDEQLMKVFGKPRSRGR